MAQAKPFVGIRPTEYLPPSDEAIDGFVKRVSERMAVTHDDPSYLDPEVIWGLAEFIKLIGRIKARQMNSAAREEVFDSLDDQNYPIDKKQQ